MNLLSRRDFLKDTAALAMLAGGACLFDPLRQAQAVTAASGKELWLVCDTPYFGKAKSGTIVVTSPGTLNVLEAAAGQSYKIDLPFLGHMLVQNPGRPSEILTFENWGQKGVLMDVREKTVLANIKADGENVFFGHSAYLTGNETIVTSEGDYNNPIGMLVVRDAKTLKPIQKMSSYGIKTHDCRSLEDGKIVMILNEGRLNSNTSNISWIEASSGKLVHQVMLNIEPGIDFSHMDIGPGGWICATGGQYEPGKDKGTCRIAFVSPDGRVIRPDIPDNVALPGMDTEALSLAFLGESGLVAATLPYADRVLLLNYQTQQFVASFAIDKPTGILHDVRSPDSDPRAIVNSRKRRGLFEIDCSATGEPAVSSENPSFGGNGSHLVRVYV